LLTHIAATESGSLCVPMKNWLRLWNLKRRLESPLHKIKRGDHSGQRLAAAIG
jgi:hypothetical protein